ADGPLPDHLVQYLAHARAGAREVLMPGVGRGDQAREVEALRQVQLDWVLAEVRLRGGPEPVHVAAPEDHVDVPLEDLRLGEPALELDRQHYLLGLALQRALAAYLLQERVLDHLRRDRGPSALGVAEELFVNGLQEGRQVEAVVAEELVVLVGDDRLESSRRYLVERDGDAVG